LVTDDTGVLDPGGWEVIAALAGSSRPSIDEGEFPGVEVSYGFYENMQLTGFVARQTLDEDGESSKSGWGQGAIGYKWRFYNKNGNALAFSPEYSFPLSGSSKVRGLVEDLRVLSLPLVGSIERGNWEFTAQASFDLTSKSVNGLGYGVWAGYSVTESLQLLAEIYGEEFSGERDETGEKIDGGVTNWRLGLSWDFAEGFSLLAAYGGAIRSDLPSEEKLDYDYFLGVRWETE
jgi:outer membrane receptor protein involved in Fe transport